jgi:hypothetical protein
MKRRELHISGRLKPAASGWLPSWASAEELGHVDIWLLFHLAIVTDMFVTDMFCGGNGTKLRGRTRLAFVGWLQRIITAEPYLILFLSAMTYFHYTLKIKGKRAGRVNLQQYSRTSL